jgi:hypothetical protein
MSLDVYLTGPEREVEEECYACGTKHKKMEQPYFYEANITHNLGKMAAAAGIYEHLWSPEEIGISKASQLIEPLTKGLELLKTKPEYFEQFNASNGWGLYKHFVPFVVDYLNACIAYPDADVSVSR